MTDKVTVSERFGTWFRAVLMTRSAFDDGSELPIPEALWTAREAWLDLQGSILGHDVQRCACIGCNATRCGEFNPHMAAAYALSRHDALQRRSA